MGGDLAGKAAIATGGSSGIGREIAPRLAEAGAAVLVADHTAQLGSVPAQRYGTPAEVAAAVAFLASDEASYIAGHVLHDDGGFGAAGVISGPEMIFEP